VTIDAALDAESAASLISAASDITMLIDDRGVVAKVNASPEFQRDGLETAVGKQWVDSVTIETRGKIEALLADAAALPGTRTSWRQVNHPSASGLDIPVLYAALKPHAQGKTIAFGRDLRSTAALQQRLVDAQHSMERDYWKLRNAETRYRLLFQMSSEAVLILDAGTQRVVEANPSVAKHLGTGASPTVGQRFPAGLDQDATEAIESLFNRVRANGRAEEVSIRLLPKNAKPGSEAQTWFVSASPFRHEQQSLLLVRISPTQTNARAEAEGRHVVDALFRAADAFVVASASGAVLWANNAFAELAHIANPEKVKGEPLDKWLGRNEVEYNVMVANLRQRGAVRLFAGGLRGEDGVTTEVEISAVALPTANPPSMAFTIRNIGGRLVTRDAKSLQGPNGHSADDHALGSGYGSSGQAASGASGMGPTGRSVEQLTALVGRVPLKDLVGETSDLIEKLCIEAALGLTEDNRAAAAEMLGLSRQSLYVKMRRHGLGDLPSDDSDLKSD
jgi:transcriptional regulator PpsR